MTAPAARQGLAGDLAAAPDELMATCWSSAGDAASDRPDLRSPLTLRERIEAASSAGFRGFGLLSDDLAAAVAEYRLSGIRNMLADNGIVHLELEGIPYWWDGGAHRAESDRVRHDLLEAAEALRARHIKVTPDGDDGPWDRGRWAEKFAELAAQAQDVHRRRYCGEGAFDLPGMITALRAAGWDGPWGLEILSDEHRSLPVREALRRAAASARGVLDPAGRGPDGSGP